MSNTVKISTLGIQINFPTWQTFNLNNLTNDGVVLFQYLVFHCENVVEWTHSDNDLLFELGLKRTRLTTLRNKFKAMGILETRIIRNQYDNKITAYRLDFAEVAKPEKLNLIYRNEDQKGQPINLAELSQAYKVLASKHPKKATKKDQSNATISERQQVGVSSSTKNFANVLEELFTDRRKEYIKALRSGQRTPVGQIRFSPTQLKNLEKAVRALDQNYIRNGFLAYCDTLNETYNGKYSELLPNKPRNMLSYFLVFKSNSSEDSYPTIRSFSEYYTTNYGIE